LDLTPIINAVIALVAVLITAVLVPWVRARTTAQQRDNLQVWVRIAVSAAEQLFAGSGRGAEKKKFAKNFLRSRGFKVNDRDVSEAVHAMLEAAVLELNREVQL